MNDLNQSLDIFGNHSGGGFCIDCLHQTTGVNCETCEEFYYNPQNISKLSDEVCQRCNCNANGSRLEPGYTFLDCLKSDSSILYSEMKSGDCFCKTNVKGSKCDQCKQGYFNLTASNGLGCQKCQCVQQGTVDGDISCTPDEGQCICKNFTTGMKCEHCKDTFFNMRNENPNGCDSCQCNLGGSESIVCNKTNGVCECHTDTIIGRQCNQLQNGFYYPSLDFISDKELVSINQLIMAWQGTLKIPRQNATSRYLFAFQCTSKVSVDAIINIGIAADRVQVERTCKNCNIVSKTPVVIQQSEINVDIIFPSVTNPELVQCIQLVGYPEEFYDSKILNHNDEFKENCDVLANNISHSVCQDQLFTLTMSYLQKPLPCECNQIGSWNGTCQPHLGQCPCKPGVTGRVCDQCMPGHYNLSEDGCTSCDCFGVDKTCHPTTGQCNCESRTVGRQCDSCEPLYWNITAGAGCQHCNCSSTGATNGECNTQTGQCECRVGVEGRGCGICSPGFKNFSAFGCRPCDCLLDGSISNICNSESGQCLCKNRTEGLQCTKCKPGSFYLDTVLAEDEGCLSCLCSGVTNNCTTASGTFQKQYSNLTLWKLISQNRIFDNIYITNRVNSTDYTFRMLSAPIFSHTDPLIWKLDSGFFGFDSVLAYTGSLSFFLEIEMNNEERYKRTTTPMVTLKVYFILFVL